MTKKEIKMLLFISILFLVVLGISYIIFTNEEKKNNSLNADVIIDGNEFLEYKNKEWNDLKNINNIKIDEFSVYNINKYIGDYIVTETNEKYYFFDSDYNSYSIDSPFIAIDKNSKLSIIEHKKINFEEEDNNIISKYLSSINIEYNGEYSTKNKYGTDLNNDGKEDYIYILCNELYSNDIIFVIFAKVNNKLITINKQINVENIENYELMWILNTTSNKYNDIIIGKSIVESYEYYLYRANNKNEYEKRLNN